MSAPARHETDAAAPEPFELASLLASYPGGETRARLAGTELDGELAPVAARPPADLESDYVELFDRGVADNPLHATGYARDRAFAVAGRLADVAGFYRAFGVVAAGGERPDHVAVELEFHAWMLRKQRYLAAADDAEGLAIVADASRKFLAEHLGPLAAAIAGRPAIGAHPVYGPVFRWIAALVAAECARLGLEITPLELARGRAEPEEVTCAAACLPAALAGRGARPGE